MTEKEKMIEMRNLLSELDRLEQASIVMTRQKDSCVHKQCRKVECSNCDKARECFLLESCLEAEQDVTYMRGKVSHELLSEHRLLHDCLDMAITVLTEKERQ